MNAPVRRTSPRDQAWVDLAAQLTPVNSLARIDSATNRAITTVTVLGTLLTGLGAVSAGQLTHSTVAQLLAASTVTAAAAAVASALTAQVLTITRRLNTANLAEVEAWYRRQSTTRAYAAQAATLLLIIAALLAGATAAAAILTSCIPALLPVDPLQITRPDGCVPPPDGRARTAPRAARS